MVMDEKREKISEMILSYLQRYPDAGDTLEGIMRWWIGFENIESSVQDVVDVLENLIQEREISVHNIVDGTTFYKVNNRM
jgi:hypothetical protein